MPHPPPPPEHYDATRHGGAENSQSLLTRLTDMNRYMGYLSQALYLCDRTLDEIAHALENSQPNFNGRYSIRWWNQGGNNPYRNPSIVRLRRLKNGHLKADPATRLVASTKDSAAICSDITQELLLLAREVIQSRKTLLNKLHSLLRVVGDVASPLRNIEYTHAIVLKRKIEVRDRLLANGITPRDGGADPLSFRMFKNEDGVFDVSYKSED